MLSFLLISQNYYFCTSMQVLYIYFYLILQIIKKKKKKEHYSIAGYIVPVKLLTGHKGLTKNVGPQTSLYAFLRIDFFYYFNGMKASLHCKTRCCTEKAKGHRK